MPFQVSPGVNITEYDLTSVIPASGGTFGALAGEFQWGPVGIGQPVSSEIKLVERFGKPPYSTSGTGNQVVDFFTAANFLQYSGSLVVSRAINAQANNAVANTKASATTAASLSRQVKNSQDYTGLTLSANSAFYARYPGDLGNNLDVGIFANSAATTLSGWVYGSLFDRVPATSEYINDTFTSTANDEIFLVVVDRTGAISGTPNTVLEKFICSKATNARDENNNSLFIKDVLLNKSRWVYYGAGIGTAALTGVTNQWGVAANSTYIFGNHDSATANQTYSLTLGSYPAVVSANVQTAMDVFLAPELDVSLIAAGGADVTAVTYAVNSVAGARKDCVVFASPTYANVTTTTPEVDVVAYRDQLPRSSYAVMDSGWKYQYDKYHDTYRWVPLNGDIAGLCARTDAEREPWFSPAGPVRGQVKNVVRLAYNPDKADRDTLYKKDVNPVITVNGEGTYLFGDKTLLGRQSAFNRINVRRLFITLERAISYAAKNALFEFNDEFTRSQFVSLVDPYLRSVQAGRGIYDYRIICDERNNTADIIDRNEFVGDIYIKPAKSVNFVQLNFVAIRTGVQFEEIIGRVV